MVVTAVEVIVLILWTVIPVAFRNDKKTKLPNSIVCFVFKTQCVGWRWTNRLHYATKGREWQRRNPKHKKFDSAETHEFRATSVKLNHIDVFMATCMCTQSLTYSNYTQNHSHTDKSLFLNTQSWRHRQHNSSFLIAHLIFLSLFQQHLHFSLTLSIINDLSQNLIKSSRSLQYICKI